MYKSLEEKKYLYPAVQHREARDMDTAAHAFQVSHISNMLCFVMT